VREHQSQTGGVYSFVQSGKKKFFTGIKEYVLLSCGWLDWGEGEKKQAKKAFLSKKLLIVGGGRKKCGVEAVIRVPTKLGKIMIEKL